MLSFEEYQREKNEEFYKGKCTEFEKEFKTFAADVRVARALATDFYEKMKKEKIINVYEFGIGSLGTRFMKWRWMNCAILLKRK